MEFIGFPKIYRYSRDCIITEKIDGTNAQIYIPAPTETGESIRAGSRKRWLTPDNDNFGFATWVLDHALELITGLGPGRHFGEWWGQGIQRGYGLKEKRFSLFNISRWNQRNPPPLCCCVVPVVYDGPFGDIVIESAMCNLKMLGSSAAPGFMNPEGIVIFHRPSGYLFKKTFIGDEKGKGEE